jgi:hypothetical protein
VTFTNQGKVFIIGGAKDKDQTEFIPNTYEVINGSPASLIEKQPMKTARLSFGCCVDKYGD